jgi:hypothetical protein
MNNIDKKVLPSNGLLKDVPREVTIRGMKGREISTLFSSLTDASIDAIIKDVTEPSLEPDLLCDEDKAFILHQTRVLTFGSEVQQTLRCPICGHIHDYVFNYDDFEINYLEENHLEEELTIGDQTIKRRIPTSETMAELKRYKEKFNLPDSYAFILLQAGKIGSINGKKKTTTELVQYLENLPGNELVKVSRFLDRKFGLETTVQVECVNCKTAFAGGIGINADLFREPDNNL